MVRQADASDGKLSGGRGGAIVLEAALGTFPRMGADIKGSFCLPSFCDNFSAAGISDETLVAQLSHAVLAFSS